jgi:putative membrane protein
MRNFILRVVINAIAIAVITAGWLPGIRLVGNNDVLILAGIGLVFGVVNGLVKPLVELMTCALTLLTFGLFKLIVGGAMLMLTAYLTTLLEPTLRGRLEVDSLWAAILGAVVAGVISLVLENIFGLNRENEDRDR